MKLVEDWKDILLNAWSMYGIYALLILSIAEAALYVFEMSLNPVLFLSLLILISVMSAFGRILDQRVEEEEEDAS